MDTWNKRDNPIPPLYTIAYSPQERVERNLDLYTQILLESLISGRALLLDEVVSMFQKEFEILATMLNLSGQFRPWKYYSTLKKIQKCGERWKHLNLASTLDTVQDLMPSVQPIHRDVRLPSRQMFVYLVVRILGGYHLLQKLDDYCKEAGVFLTARISSGHFSCHAMALLAIAARIRALAVDLCGQLITLYNAIFPCLQQLKSSDAPELVSLSALPSSLPDVQSKGDLSTDNNNFINLSEAKDKSSILQEAEDHSKATTMLPEDIGMCVEEMRNHIITPANKVKKNKKRKLVSDLDDQNKICTIVKKKQTSKKKKERNTEDLKSNKKTTAFSTPSQEGGVSSAFVTHYTKVMAATNALNSHKDITQFFKREQKRRFNKSDDRISLHIKNSGWNELRNTLIQQLSSSKKRGKQNTEDESAKLCRVKTRLKFWLLYPKLKGNKPQDWSKQLRNIKLNKQKRRKS